jgi:hypothetical protein
MATFGHARGDRGAQTNWTRRFLGDGRCQNLQDVVPVQMDVGIYTLRAVVSTRIDNEAVVCVDESCLVDGMVARAEAPGRSASGASGVAVGVVVLGTGRKAKVHQVGDGRLALAVAERTHGELVASVGGSPGACWYSAYRFGNRILIRLAKSFGALVLLAALLVVAWSGRGPGRRARCGATPLLAERGPAGAEALAAAADGGLEDMAPPGWVEAEAEAKVEAGMESKTAADVGVED